MTDADQLARLRVAATTGRLPADLGRWAVARLVELAPAAERLALRDHLLRAAAELLDGSTWARARRLRAELLGLGRRHSPLDELRALLVEVLELDPACPTSIRQLLRILAGDMDPGGDVTTSGGTL